MRLIRRIKHARYLYGVLSGLICSTLILPADTAFSLAVQPFAAPLAKEDGQANILRSFIAYRLAESGWITPDQTQKVLTIEDFASQRLNLPDPAYSRIRVSRLIDSGDGKYSLVAYVSGQPFVAEIMPGHPPGVMVKAFRRMSFMPTGSTDSVLSQPTEFSPDLILENDLISAARRVKNIVKKGIRLEGEAFYSLAEFGQTCYGRWRADIELLTSTGTWHDTDPTEEDIRSMAVVLHAVGMVYYSLRSGENTPRRLDNIKRARWFFSMASRLLPEDLALRYDVVQTLSHDNRFYNDAYNAAVALRQEALKTSTSPAFMERYNTQIIEILIKQADHKMKAIEKAGQASPEEIDDLIKKLEEVESLASFITRPRGLLAVGAMHSLRTRLAGFQGIKFMGERENDAGVMRFYIERIDLSLGTMISAVMLSVSNPEQFLHSAKVLNFRLGDLVSKLFEISDEAEPGLFQDPEIAQGFALLDTRLYEIQTYKDHAGRQILPDPADMNLVASVRSRIVERSSKGISGKMVKKVEKYAGDFFPRYLSDFLEKDFYWDKTSLGSEPGRTLSMLREKIASDIKVNRLMEGDAEWQVLSKEMKRALLPALEKAMKDLFTGTVNHLADHIFASPEDLAIAAAIKTIPRDELRSSAVYEKANTLVESFIENGKFEVSLQKASSALGVYVTPATNVEFEISTITLDQLDPKSASLIQSRDLKCLDVAVKSSDWKVRACTLREMRNMAHKIDPVSDTETNEEALAPYIERFRAVADDDRSFKVRYIALKYMDDLHKKIKFPGHDIYNKRWRRYQMFYRETASAMAQMSKTQKGKLEDLAEKVLHDEDAGIARRGVRVLAATGATDKLDILRDMMINGHLFDFMADEIARTIAGLSPKEPDTLRKEIGNFYGASEKGRQMAQRLMRWGDSVPGVGTIKTTDLRDRFGDISERSARYTEQLAGDNIESDELQKINIENVFLERDLSAANEDLSVSISLIIRHITERSEGVDKTIRDIVASVHEGELGVRYNWIEDHIGELQVKARTLEMIKDEKGVEPGEEADVYLDASRFRQIGQNLDLTVDRIENAMLNIHFGYSAVLEEIDDHLNEVPELVDIVKDVYPAAAFTMKQYCDELVLLRNDLINTAFQGSPAADLEADLAGISEGLASSRRFVTFLKSRLSHILGAIDVQDEAGVMIKRNILKDVFQAPSNTAWSGLPSSDMWEYFPEEKWPEFFDLLERKASLAAAANDLRTRTSVFASKLREEPFAPLRGEASRVMELCDIAISDIFQIKVSSVFAPAERDGGIGVVEHKLDGVDKTLDEAVSSYDKTTQRYVKIWKKELAFSGEALKSALVDWGEKWKAATGDGSLLDAALEPGQKDDLPEILSDISKKASGAREKYIADFLNLDNVNIAGEHVAFEGEDINEVYGAIYSHVKERFGSPNVAMSLTDNDLLEARIKESFEKETGKLKNIHVLFSTPRPYSFPWVRVGVKKEDPGSIQEKFLTLDDVLKKVPAKHRDIMSKFKKLMTRTIDGHNSFLVRRVPSFDDFGSFLAKLGMFSSFHYELARRVSDPERTIHIDHAQFLCVPVINEKGLMDDIHFSVVYYVQESSSYSVVSFRVSEVIKEKTPDTSAGDSFAVIEHFLSSKIKALNEISVFEYAEGDVRPLPPDLYLAAIEELGVYYSKISKLDPLSPSADGKPLAIRAVLDSIFENKISRKKGRLSNKPLEGVSAHKENPLFSEGTLDKIEQLYSEWKVSGERFDLSRESSRVKEDLATAFETLSGRGPSGPGEDIFSIPTLRKGLKKPLRPLLLYPESNEYNGIYFDPGEQRFSLMPDVGGPEGAMLLEMINKAMDAYTLRLSRSIKLLSRGDDKDRAVAERAISGLQEIFSGFSPERFMTITLRKDLITNSMLSGRNRIILDRGFTEFLMKRYYEDPDDDTPLIILAERLFHELGHASLKRAEMPAVEEEAVQLARDALFYLLVVARDSDLAGSIEDLTDSPVGPYGGQNEKFSRVFNTTALFRHVRGWSGVIETGDTDSLLPLIEEFVEDALGDLYAGVKSRGFNLFPSVKKDGLRTANLALARSLVRGLSEIENRMMDSHKTWNPANIPGRILISSSLIPLSQKKLAEEINAASRASFLAGYTDELIEICHPSRLNNLMRDSAFDSVAVLEKKDVMTYDWTGRKRIVFSKMAEEPVLINGLTASARALLMESPVRLLQAVSWTAGFDLDHLPDVSTLREILERGDYDALAGIFEIVLPEMGILSADIVEINRMIKEAMIYA